MKINLIIPFVLIANILELNAATVYCTCKNTGQSRTYNTKKEISLTADPRPVCDQFCADKGGALNAIKR